MVSLNLLWGLVIILITLSIELPEYLFTVSLSIFFLLVHTISFFIARRPFVRIRKYKDPRVRQVEEFFGENLVTFFINVFMFALVTYPIIIAPECLYYVISVFWLLGIYDFIEVGKALAKTEHNRTIVPWD